MKAQAIYHQNRSLYNESGIVDIYVEKIDTQGLLDGEKTIFAQIQGELEQAAILDIGVGAGRTTRYLSNLGRSYVGIDYSAAMVESCRDLCPGVDVRLGDATNMEMFEEDRFDVVVFSFNGIDHVVHEDRLRILREVHRVLRPSGVFIFSTHNLDRPKMVPFTWPRFRSPDHQGPPVRGTLKAIAQKGREIFNYLRNKRYETHHDGHAMLVDLVYEYRLLMYHITADAQTRQLEEVGFGDLLMVDRQGEILPQGERCEDAWIYFLARAR